MRWSYVYYSQFEPVPERGYDFAIIFDWFNESSAQITDATKTPGLAGHTRLVLCRKIPSGRFLQDHVDQVSRCSRHLP
jgi:hypothetical protein